MTDRDVRDRHEIIADLVAERKINYGLRAEVERLRAALADMAEITLRNAEPVMLLDAIRKCAMHALEPPA